MIIKKMAGTIGLRLIILLTFLLSLWACTPSSSDLPDGTGGTGGTGGTTSAGVSVSSNPSSIPTYALSSISATVRDAGGVLVADGTSVTFAVSDSTIGTLSASTATTTGGIAKVYFTAGNKTGEVSITATSGDLSGSVTIFITASTTSAISMMASPSSIPVSGTSTITAQVVDSTGNPVVDDTLVVFALDDPGKGNITTNAFTTNGTAIATFTASSTASGTVTIGAVSDTVSGEIPVTITGGIAGGSMTIEASSSSITTNGTATISATITDSGGIPISGATVSFSVNSTAATLSSATALTDGSGDAQVTVTAGSSAGAVTVTATSSTLTSSTTITITQATGAGRMDMTASSTSIQTESSTTITTTVVDGTGNPIAGVTVNYSLSVDDTVASLGSATTTNTSGVSQVVLTSGKVPTTVTVSATATTGSGTLDNTVTVTITAPTPANVGVSVNPSSITVLGTTTITATVTDENKDPVIDGTAVSFSLSSDTYGALSSSTTTTANGNGTATTTFTGSNSPGTATVMATAGTVSSTASVTVTPASTGSISFVEAVPQVIGLKASGQTESSAIKFIVNDINGNPVSDGTAVSFLMKGPNGGEYIGEVDGTPATATGSTVNGYATVILNSGTVAGPVTVTASTNINVGDPTTLSAAITDTDTTIPVASTTGFSTSGRIRIDNELIDYTGTTANTFTGCSRGAVSTVAMSHSTASKVYNQNTISSSATQISIGGGVPSATHLSIATEIGKINMPGYLPDGGLVNEQARISIYMADRFGNYNVLDGTSVSFYAEGGAIDRQGIADATGEGSVIFRTQNPMPEDVAEAAAGSSGSTAYFRGAAEPWYTSGSITYNPRDGWVDIIATTLGEEAFADENVDGLFTRSYASSTSICPYGYSCECDGGASSVSGGSTCGAAGNRSEGFIDLGEPFYDVNDDGVRDNGLTSGKPFELYIDANSNGTYNTPNGMWDGPDCQSDTCEKNKMIWINTKSVFSGSGGQRQSAFYPWPDPINCYNLASENPTCSATYDPDDPGNAFAVAPASIARGSAGSFTVIIGDVNLNRLQVGTTVAVTASTGTVAPSSIPAIADGLSTGPSIISFSVEIPLTETKTISTVTVEVTTPTGATATAQIVVPISD